MKHLFQKTMYCLLAILLLVPGLAFSAGSGNIKIITFNILAPCWASPNYYPASSLPFLDRAYRRDKIISFLLSEASTTDIFALQETTQVELTYINNALKSQYDMYAAYHSPSYWSEWVTENPPWELNGVALFIRKGLLTHVTFQDTPLTDDGNHCSYVQGTLKNNSSNRLRIASIHLDTANAGSREREFNAVLDIMTPQANTVDIIAGDLNFEIENGNLSQNVSNAGFVDILTSLGIDGNTSPFSTTFYNSENWSDIDHIMIRNASPVTGKIYNFDLYNLYPGNAGEEARFNANLSLCGSDHFPVTGTGKY